jgi:hypothetical protein
MNTATLGKMILIADMSGDRPALITKVFTADSAEACAFTPLPEHVKVVKIHVDRREAITASQRDAKFHAYWAPKA